MAFIEIALPLLVAALLAVTLVQYGKVQHLADETNAEAQRTQMLARNNHELLTRLDIALIQLHSGLVNGCEKNGNTVRRILRTILNAEIQKSHTIPPRFFPGIPPATFNRLIREGNEASRDRIEELAPVNCPKQYATPAVSNPGGS